jgi:hypothetical protein
MTDVERLSTQVSDAVRVTLQRLSALIMVVAVLAAVVGVATFATGWWVFDRSHGTWLVVGGILCAVPVGSALLGWFYVSATSRRAPTLVNDVRVLLSESRTAAAALIEHDSGATLAVSARSLGSLRNELRSRRKELPALFAGVRAISSVPGLAAIAVLGVVLVGGLGTILLIGGVID